MVAQTRPNKEKEQVPWCIQFTRKDLLNAAWGSKKGADLLYHFLNKASWERKNHKLPETLKDIKFQEATPKALEKSGLSLGCFHTYLKHFVSVGYVSTQAYSGEYTVHLETIQQAFSDTPEKPVTETGKHRQPRPKSFNLKDCNFVTLPREDYEMLVAMKDECFNLKEMFHSLKDSYAQTLAEMKEMFHSLKQNPTIYTAQEAGSEPFSDLQSNAFREESNAFREERQTDAGASSFFELLSFIWTDNLETPSRLLVQITNTLLAGELQQRLSVVEHYKQALQEKGITVLVEMISNPPEHTVEATMIPDALRDNLCAILAAYAPIPENLSYSQETTKQSTSQQNQEKLSELPDAGYKQTIDVNTSSQRKEEKPSTPAREKGKRVKKEKVEQPRLPFGKGIALAEDEQRVFDLYCQLWFIAIPPKVNDNFKGHCKTLAPFVHTLEEMESLEKVARKYTKSIDKETRVLALGWFTNDKVLNPWIAEQKQPPVQKPTSSVIRLDEERVKREEEKNQRNIEANKQETKIRLQEKMASGRKLQNFEVVMAAERFGLELPPQYREQYLASKQQVAIGQ